MNKSWFSNTMYDCFKKLKGAWSSGQKIVLYVSSNKEAIVSCARGVGQEGQFSRVGPRGRERVGW